MSDHRSDDVRELMPELTGVGERSLDSFLTPVVRVTEEIAAPPEEVFEALTDPEALGEWFLAPGGTTRDWELDLAPGGEWSARTVTPDGAEGVLHGDVITVDAPNTLELTWHTSDDDFAPSRVRYDLEPIWVNGECATRLTVTHVDGTSVDGVSTYPQALMVDVTTTTHAWTEQIRRLGHCVRTMITVA